MVEITPGDHPDEERAVKSNIVWVSVGCRLSGASGATRPGARRRRAMRGDASCACVGVPGPVVSVFSFSSGWASFSAHAALPRPCTSRRACLKTFPRHATFV